MQYLEKFPEFEFAAPLLPYLDEFLLDLVNQNYSERTLISYQRDIFIFACFLNYQKIKIDNLTKLQISRYKEFLRSGNYLKEVNKVRKEMKLETVAENVEQEGEKKKSSSDASKRSSMYSGRLSSRSVNRMLSVLRTYFRFLDDADYKLPISPDSIKLIKAEKKIGQVAELDELVKLLEYPEQFEKNRKVRYRNRAMLELLFSTGMRISELISLNIQDLKLDKDLKKIRDVRIFILGKGRKQRFVYMTDRAKAYLERYLASRKDEYPALFIPYRGLRAGTKDPYQVRVSTNYLQAKIKNYRLALGINVPTSAHSFRHGFATYLAENGANPAAIQHLLGHESLQTTSRYVHASDKYAKKAHEEYHPLPEGK